MKRVLFLTLSLCLLFLGANSKEFKLSIIHMNDIHSHLDEESMKLNIDGVKLKVDAGGYPRVATIIKQKLKRSIHPLLLNAGDALQGTLYYTLFKGEVDAKMMDLLPWDAFVLGNHEFDDGDKNLKHFLAKLKVPIIAANVYADKNDVLYRSWKPYIIKHYGDEDVAIIGIDILKATKYASNPSKNIDFYDELKTARKYVKILKKKGVNKIILLSHFGYKNDIRLAKEVGGIDVIVGGHTHTLMGDYSSLGLKGSIPYPKRVLSKEGNLTCIVQAYAYCKIIGDLEVVFDENGKILTCKGSPLLAISDNFKIKNSNKRYVDIDKKLREKVEKSIEKRDDIEIVKKDRFVQSILKNYKKQIDAKEKEIVAIASKTMHHVRIPGRSHSVNRGVNLPLGSEVVPVVAKAFYERVKGSDAVIINAGGVRTDIKKGDISIKDVYTLLPFSNTLYSMRMRGWQIHQILEDALQSVIKLDSSGAFPYAYGLRYSVDMNEKMGYRIKNLEILDKRGRRFHKIEKNRIYNITTISYLASGKDGYDIFTAVKGLDTYFDYANSFVVYLKNLQKRGEELTKLPSWQHCIKSFK